jgi:hypothetical protein
MTIQESYVRGLAQGLSLGPGPGECHITASAANRLQISNFLPSPKLGEADLQCHGKAPADALRTRSISLAAPPPQLCCVPRTLVGFSCATLHPECLFTCTHMLLQGLKLQHCGLPTRASLVHSWKCLTCYLKRHALMLLLHRSCGLGKAAALM